jgi:hypothetical protein
MGRRLGALRPRRAPMADGRAPTGYIAGSSTLSLHQTPGGPSMSGSDLSAAVQSLINHHIPSMDHVAVLLALHGTPEQAHGSADVARQTRVERDVVDRTLRELAASHLIRRDGDQFQYAPPSALRGAVDELAEMYRTRPVTLVRAVYERPARAIQSFADAFRLRQEGT